MKPLIGILTCGYMEHRQFVTDSYIRAINLSGGLPVLIPALPPTSDLSSYLHLCDGFLLPGGGDLSPLLSNESFKEGIGAVCLNLDVFQIHFTEEILKTKKPLLGICRGMQILNVAFGGTLYQDMRYQPGNPSLHMQTSRQRSEPCHQVSVKPDTLLYHLTGPSLFTNSFHHQSIASVGQGLVVSGQTEDGTIEALEFPDAPFVLGVQWHPEAMFFSHPAMRKLFLHFVKLCV